MAHNLQEPSYVFRAPKQLSSPLEDILEEGMATQSGILAWGIRWTETPDGPGSMALWLKAQHEGALPPPCIVRKDPRVPHTARRGA